ncbi:MAG: glycoside hydrolase family 3 protein, partial [Calditrichaeota bacterium]|nr:glycoside hydrolase family 3 protein [Calditrichota bacterium]
MRQIPIQKVFILVVLAFGLMSAQKVPDYLNSKLPVDQRVNDLLSRMTLEEKIGQMCQYVGLEHQREVARENLGANVNVDDAHGFYPNLSPSDVEKLVIEGKVGSFLHVVTAKEANELQKLALKSRLKIPLLIGIDAIHGNGLVRGATIYPTPITLASSWDPKMVEEIGRQTAVEMRAEGMQWAFTPNVDVARDPRWGRVGETFGEDPVLVSQMGVAMIRGLQNGNPSPEEETIACAKHMVGGGEPLNGTNAAPTDISRRTLFEIFLPSFQAAVNAGVYTIMAAHNEIEGQPCHGSHYLLTDILRNRMGFKGFVVSDWMDIERLYTLHKTASSDEDAYRQAVNAGIDMHMHGPGFFKGVLHLVKNGKIPESRIDEAALAILKAKFQLGLFEHRFVDMKKIPKRVYTPAHRDLALRAARESVILLKNDGLLPLSSSRKMQILVTGPNA